MWPKKRGPSSLQALRPGSLLRNQAPFFVRTNSSTDGAFFLAGAFARCGHLPVRVWPIEGSEAPGATIPVEGR